MGDLISFESRRVGKIEVSEAEVVTFEPLPGFPNRSRFVIMEHAEAAEMAWLVSLEDPDLAFVVAAPWTFFPNYDPPLERNISRPSGSRSARKSSCSRSSRCRGNRSS